MRAKMMVFFLIITFVTLCWSEDETTTREPVPDHYFFNFSIYYPLSINKTKKDSVNLNLSLVYGHVGRVNGIDLAAICSVVEDDLRGIQLAGLGGIVGDSMKGIQVSGLFSIAGDRSAGIQTSGIFSITGNDFKGIQSSSIFNIVGDRFKGIQASGIFNIVGEKFTGLQASGLFNIVGDNFSGLQASGIFNIVGDKGNGLQVGTINFVGEKFSGLQVGVLDFVGEEFNGFQVGTLNFVGDMFRGVQIGTLNFSTNLSGLQVGVVNLGVSVKGVQLGVVNVSDKIEGIPVGLVNLSRAGRIRWVTWGNNITPINTGFKMMVRNVYSILSIGVTNLEKDISSSLSYGFHYGVHFPFKKYFFDLDIGYVNIDNEKFFRSTAGDIDQHLLEARVMFGIDISRYFSIFAGGGIGYMVDHHENFESGTSHPIFFAGMELFNFNFLPVR